jgi:hypothetical protein
MLNAVNRWRQHVFGRNAEGVITTVGASEHVNTLISSRIAKQTDGRPNTPRTFLKCHPFRRTLIHGFYHASANSLKALAECHALTGVCESRALLARQSGKPPAREEL